MDKSEIVARADELRAQLDGMNDSAVIQRIIAEHDLVWAVWRDPAEPDGVGTLIIKGKRRLEAAASGVEGAPSGTVRFDPGDLEVTWAAVPCKSPEAAVAMHWTFGERELD
jgi:hypothetical protein